jgi:surface antigen
VAKTCRYIYRAFSLSLLFSLSLFVLSPSVEAHTIAQPKATNWQCVTFARAYTGMQIFGDAWTWWQQATKSDTFETGQTPKPGAVLVFRPQGKIGRGHVSVVSQIITDRLIQITHANWSPIDGRRGQVEENVSVVDVSEAGDWSAVKVWYAPLEAMGTTVYTTYGFIYKPQTFEDLDSQKDQTLAALSEDSPKAQTLSPLSVNLEVRSDIQSRDMVLVLQNTKRSDKLIRDKAKTYRLLSGLALNSKKSADQVAVRQKRATKLAANLAANLAKGERKIDAELAHSLLLPKLASVLP